VNTPGYGHDCPIADFATREIPLTRGYVAVVDASDYPALSQHKWCALKSGHTVYAVRAVPKGSGRGMICMHRAILGLPLGRVPMVDHINGNGLDNRRANLRLASRSDNGANRRKFAIGASRFKGVTLKRGRWCAAIRRLGKAHHIGYYGTEEEAARAYDAAARERFGNFALLNFPTEAVA
jgi:hypothetical protein